MNFNNIRNLGNPKSNNDAVPRKFVDDIAKDLEEKIEKRKQLIAASASYHGDLIKGDYQFTWSGKSMETYKKHDMFSGFLIPSSGYIKKFVVLDTGFKLNTQKNRNFLDFIVYDIGYNTHIPLFTLVLIRQDKDPIDIGTLYFYFIDYNVGDTALRGEVFKFNPDFEEKTLRTIEAKDIINIRSELNTINLGENRVFTAKPNYKATSIDFFTYLATVLIELDPLEDDN